jgi:YVTN family beta-propeller protein
MEKKRECRCAFALKKWVVVICSVAVCLCTATGRAQQELRVGSRTVGGVYGGAIMVSTGQLVRPAGTTLAFAGRPVDLALSKNERLLFIKTVEGLVIADAHSLVVRQVLPFGKGAGGSMHGIAVAPGDRNVYLTASGSTIFEASPGNADTGGWFWARRISVPAADHSDSYPCGLAISRDGARVFVALSRSNSLVIVDLKAGSVEQEIPVGVAPFDVVLSDDEHFAYVSNWGGRRPLAGDRTMKSSGTETLVDDRGIPMSGTLAEVDLQSGRVAAEIPVGLHPSTLARSQDGSRLYVANANSDNVSEIDLRVFRVTRTIGVRPDSLLPFGSVTDGVALSPDGNTLFASNGGNNAVAVVPLAGGGSGGAKPSGFIPAGWFPAAVVAGREYLFVANTKGEGSRQAEKNTTKWFVKWQRGTVSRIDYPDRDLLANMTNQVDTLSRVRVTLNECSPRQVDGAMKAIPVPKLPGEPSVFRHVVFVLKENRTYDQVLGDMHKGNSDSALCIYGRDVTPNHHALASQFVLLDNYYCSGIVSADGHQWATQGITTDYQEKAWGTWSRSYDFGTDPLAFAPTDFLWDHALLHGRSFRNYGEFDFPSIVPDTATWFTVYDDAVHRRGSVGFVPNLPLESLRPYTCAQYPGWNLRIPDMVRLDRFMKEFREYEKKGGWPDLVFVYLPQDHTSGTRMDAPTPRAYVADNDLALGKLVEAISRSRYWASTCIFVNEDDPQDGFDHVDGHRSLCLVVSPYTKRGEVVSSFYNQSSVLHTIERILGLPPMNQLDAVAPTMEDCFVEKPDLTPYTAEPNRIPLDERNKMSSDRRGEGWRDRTLSEEFDFTRPDRIDDDLMNRILWFAAKGGAVPYPTAYAGAHGRGLRPLGLKAVTCPANAEEQ